MGAPRTRGNGRTPRPPASKGYFLGKSAEADRRAPRDSNLQEAKEAVAEIRDAELKRRAI